MHSEHAYEHSNVIGSLVMTSLGHGSTGRRVDIGCPIDVVGQEISTGVTTSESVQEIIK